MEDKRVILENGSPIGDYTIKKHIGSGGTGIVYKAVSSQGKIVIIKEVFPIELAGKDMLYRADDGRILFSSDANDEYVKTVKQKIKKNLEREIENTNYAKYNYENLGTSEEVFYAEKLEKDDALENELAMYIVMETGDGCSLKEFLDELKVEKGNLIYYILIIKQLLSTLGNMYPIIHLDLKPSNIFVRKNEDDIRLTILDFGSSVNVDNLKSIISAIFENKTIINKNDNENNIEKILEVFNPSYSMGFAAPEMVSCVESYSNCNDGNFLYYVNRIDQRSDSYSVGAILYYMLTSHKYVVDEFVGNNIDEEIRNIDALKEYSSECVGKLVSFLNRTLAYDIEERYVEYSTIWNEIKDIFDSIGGTDIRKSTGNGKTRLYTPEHVKEAKRQSYDEIEKKKCIHPTSANTNDNTYIERTELVDALRYRIENIEGAKKMIFITGMGGIGKSELARSYANIYYGGSNANDESNLYSREVLLTYPEDKIVGINELLEDNGYDYYLNKYTEFGPDTLIIIDNFNIDVTSKCDEDARKVENFLEDICKNTGEAHIIFTSRLNIFTDYITFDIEDKVTLDFACQVFESNYKKNVDETEKAAVEEICKAVSYIDANGRVIGCNLLAISLIAKQLRNQKHTTIIEFNNTIQRGIKDAVDEEFVQAYHNKRYQEYTVYEILFDVIFEKLLLLRSSSKKDDSSEKGDFKPIEKDVLRVMSCCPAQEKDMDTICRIVYGDGAITWREIKRTTKLLCDLGWIRLIEDNKDEHKRISVHPLVVEFFREKYKENEDEEEQYLRLAKNAFCLKDEDILNESYLVWKLWQQMNVDLQNQVLIEDEELSNYQLVYNSFFGKKKMNALFNQRFMNSEGAIMFSAEYDSSKIYGYVSMDWHGGHERVLLGNCAKDKILDNVNLLCLIDGCSYYKLIIPDYIMGVTVKNIPDNFALYNMKIFKLVLPKYLTRIGKRAFMGCKNIESNIWINDLLKLERVEDYAFCDCIGLYGNLFFRDGVKYIGKYAFNNCKNLDGDLKLSNELETIESHCFCNCKSFRGNLRIPEKVVVICNSAFEGCGFDGRLIFFNKKLEEINYCAFKNCVHLCGALEFPGSLKKIEGYAFEGCKGLTGDIEIPYGIENIERGAFENCEGFNGNLKLPSTVKTIEEKAFSGCANISGELKLPALIEYIGFHSFFGCENITEITDANGDLKRPSRLEWIGMDAFLGCDKLNAILDFPLSISEYLAPYIDASGIFHSGYVWTGGYDFNFLIENYKNYIKYMENFVFPYNEEIESCDMYYVDNVTEIPEFEFQGKFEDERYCLKLSDNITSIGGCAFRGCYGLVGTLEIPKNVKTIGDAAFLGCCGLTQIKLPDKLENIKAGAFYGCSNIAGNLRIPGSIKVLGEECFADCTSLNGSLIFDLDESSHLKEIPYAAFQNCQFTGNLELPVGIEKIGDYAFYGCKKFSGKLVIPESVNEIGVSAFEGSGVFLGDVKIPDKVSVIKENSFSGFFTYGRIILPDSIEKIEKEAFRNCIGIKGPLNLPCNLTSLGERALEKCISLSGVVKIREKVKTIGRNAFIGCPITTIEFPDINILFPDDYIADKDVIFRVYPNTTAERYARKYGYDYIYYE